MNAIVTTATMNVITLCVIASAVSEHEDARSVAALHGVAHPLVDLVAFDELAERPPPFRDVVDVVRQLVSESRRLVDEGRDEEGAIATITPSASSEVSAVAVPRRKPRRSNASTAGLSASAAKIGDDDSREHLARDPGDVEQEEKAEGDPGARRGPWSGRMRTIRSSAGTAQGSPDGRTSRSVPACRKCMWMSLEGRRSSREGRAARRPGLSRLGRCARRLLCAPARYRHGRDRARRGRPGGRVGEHGARPRARERGARARQGGRGQARVRRPRADGGSGLESPWRTPSNEVQATLHTS